MNNRLQQIQQILAAENNENNHFDLPYIRLKETESFFNSLLFTKIKQNLNNSNDISINIKKAKNENSFSNYNKSKLKNRSEINQENTSDKINRSS